MQSIALGKTDLKIPPLVFGGNVFGWTLDEPKSFEMLDDLYARGFTAIDTADAYSRWAQGNSGGESETIIGKWLASRKHRDSITLITKVGHDMGQGHTDLSADYITKACEDSLERLQTDHIDLYFSHFDDERTAPEETMRAYDKLVQVGKVRTIGASNLSVDRIESSLAASQAENLVSYQVLQPEYNLYARQEFENKYAPLAREHGFGVITYWTLASGFLSGKYRDESDLDKSERGSGAQKYLKSERGKAILAALDDVSGKHDVSPASVAIAWVMNRPEVTAPIVSATKPEHVAAFSTAVDLQLSDDDLKRLDVNLPEAA